MAEQPSLPPSDPLFRKFIDDLQKTNSRGFATQLLQLKYEKEIANEDGDKREEQLEELINSVKDLHKGLTGISVDFNLQPVTDELSNQTKILQKSLEELAVLRKVNEGSLEYDKESAGYRNTSGREITSQVSGKAIKPGQYVDFETARDFLQGTAGKRAQEANKLELLPTGVPGQQAKVSITGGSKSEAVRGSDKDKDPLANKLSAIEVKPDERTWKEFGKELAGLFKGKEGFTAAKGRYAAEFTKAGRGTEEEGMRAYEKIVELEKSVEESRKYGFEPKEKIEELRQLKFGEPEQVGTEPKLKVGSNPESDNIQSSDEILADASKEDLELTKDSNRILAEQLAELKLIKNSLSPEAPVEMKKSAIKPIPGQEEKEKVESAELPSIDIDLPGKKKGPIGKRGLGKSIGSKLLGAARFAGPVAALAAAGTAAYGGVQGYQRAGENFELAEGQESTTGQKISSALGGAASSLSFGLIDEKSAAQGIQKAGSAVKSFFGFGDKTPAVTPSVPATQPGATVANTSTANADMSRGLSSSSPSLPPIVSSSVNNVNNTSYVPIKPSARTDGSSTLDRYLNRIAAY